MENSSNEKSDTSSSSSDEDLEENLDWLITHSEAREKAHIVNCALLQYFY